MTNSNSRRHSRKVSLDAAVSNSIEKAVNARKVAAFTVGAAGVLAGAAFAFGATPAMAADADSSSVNPSSGKQDSTYDAYDSYGAYDANAYDTYSTDAYDTYDTNKYDTYNAYDTSDNSTYDYNSENKKTLAEEEDRAGEEKKPNEVDFSKSMPNVYELSLIHI